MGTAYLPKYQMSLDWTLAICIRKPGTLLTPVEYVHVQDLDATLTLAYWDEGDGAFGWELDAAKIDGITVTAKTDRDLWQIIKRAVDHHDADINERVQDFARECEAA